MKNIIATAFLLTICLGANAQVPNKKGAPKDDATQTQQQTGGLLIATATVSSPQVDLAQPGGASLPADPEATVSQLKPERVTGPTRPATVIVNGKPVQPKLADDGKIQEMEIKK